MVGHGNPIEAPEPVDPEFVQLMRSHPNMTGWATVAHLCMDAEMQDNGVDVRLWAWPMEFKYQGGNWWERDHMDDREWRRTAAMPLQIRSRL